MSGTVAERKRLIRVTASDLRQSRLYVTGHLDFFPRQCRAASPDAGAARRKIRISLNGQVESVETTLGGVTNNGGGRPYLSGTNFLIRQARRPSSFCHSRGPPNAFSMSCFAENSCEKIALLSSPASLPLSM